MPTSIHLAQELSQSQQHLICSAVDPDADLAAYAHEVMKYCLNGVDKVFWRDWPGAEPSTFLTTEPLHQWHKMFWDHDAKWCIQALDLLRLTFNFLSFCITLGFISSEKGSLNSSKSLGGNNVMYNDTLSLSLLVQFHRIFSVYLLPHRFSLPWPSSHYHRHTLHRHHSHTGWLPHTQSINPWCRCMCQTGKQAHQQLLHPKVGVDAEHCLQHSC